VAVHVFYLLEPPARFHSTVFFEQFIALFCLSVVFVKHQNAAGESISVGIFLFGFHADSPYRNIGFCLDFVM